MKKIFLIVLLFFFLFKLKAQTDVDAFRYNWQLPSGTARFDGMAGAVSALGGDVSALTINPATIATINRKTFGLSLGVNSILSQTSYVGVNSQAKKSVFIAPNIHGVFVKKTDSKLNKAWRTFQFGMSYNRIAEYNKITTVNGSQNNNHAFLDGFAFTANGLSPIDLEDPNFFEAFYSNLAYKTNLIQHDDTVVFGPGDTAYNLYRNEFFDYPNIEQNRTLRESGGLDEINFSVGANYDDLFYMGLTVGVLTGKYRSILSFSESSLSDSTSLSNYTFNEELRQDAIGLSFKLGLLYRPYPWLRVGAAFHAPYKLKITENYQTDIVSNFKNGTSLKAESPNYAVQKFWVRNPAKLILSAGVTYKKILALGVVYTLKNYNNMELIAGDDVEFNYDFENENLIRPYYKTAHSLSVGLEFKLAKIFALRGGYSVYTSPFELESQFTQQVSGGVGYRNRFFFIDLSYKHFVQGSYNYLMYQEAGTDLVNQKDTFGQYNVTVGIRLR